MAYATGIFDPSTDSLQQAGFISDYTMRGQHTADRAMTRGRHDLGKMVENNEISTGPGRWVLGVPNAYGNAAFIPTPTTLNQKWGASHIMTSTKTDTESDLRNIGRPSVKTTGGQYTPEHGAAMSAGLVAMPEAVFPQTASHLVDPPATLRGTGINRWEWLHDNPQQDPMIPFEHCMDSRHANKDATFAALSAKLVSDRLMIDPGVGLPIPRTQRPGEPPSFNDTIPGALQRPASSDAPAPAPAGAPVPRTVYKSNWSSVSNAVQQDERNGILAPPPPFGQFIAPH